MAERARAQLDRRLARARQVRAARAVAALAKPARVARAAAALAKLERAARTLAVSPRAPWSVVRAPVVPLSTASFLAAAAHLLLAFSRRTAALALPGPMRVASAALALVLRPRGAANSIPVRLLRPTAVTRYRSVAASSRAAPATWLAPERRAYGLARGPRGSALAGGVDPRRRATRASAVSCRAACLRWLKD